MKSIIVYAILVFISGIVSLIAIFFGLRFVENSYTNNPSNSDTTTLGLKTEKDVYSVIDIVDGDTARVVLNGEKFTVRLIGIDTPELNTANYKGKECFAGEAKARLTQLLEGKKVKLELDQTQGEYDRYNRLLAYIWLGEQLVNQIMISEGYAFEYTYNLPYKYQTRFKKSEKEAREAMRGLWGQACEY